MGSYNIESTHANMRCTLELLKFFLCPSVEFSNFFYVSPGHFVFLLIFKNEIVLTILFSK